MSIAPGTEHRAQSALICRDPRDHADVRALTTTSDCHPAARSPVSRVSPRHQADSYADLVVERRGIIWVIDSPTGHLAVASRAGVLSQYLGEPTRLFKSVDAVIDALPPKFPPTALVFGYAEIEPAVHVVLDPPHASLKGIPVYIADAHRDWPLNDLPSERVFHSADSGSTYAEGLEWFRDHVLGGAR